MKKSIIASKTPSRTVSRAIGGQSGRGAEDCCGAAVAATRRRGGPARVDVSGHGRTAAARVRLVPEPVYPGTSSTWHQAALRGIWRRDARHSAPTPVADRAAPAPSARHAASRRVRLARAPARARRLPAQPARADPPSRWAADGGRRRTPGLRREEVAQLAGVGVTWYTWLEQGRDINVSEQVLERDRPDAAARPHERAHLFTLAGVPLPAGASSAGRHAGIRPMLDKLDPFPALVINGALRLPRLQPGLRAGRRRPRRAAPRGAQLPVADVRQRDGEPLPRRLGRGRPA